jgi:hypothetical protein
MTTMGRCICTQDNKIQSPGLAPADVAMVVMLAAEEQAA